MTASSINQDTRNHNTSTDNVSASVHIHPYDITSPLPENYKILHWIRHAEGSHNVNQQYRDIANLDARLTELGRQQCAQLAQRIRQARDGPLYTLQQEPVLLVTSPLTRCIETALQSLPVQHTRIVAHEDIRETVNYNCDRRRPLSQIRNEFPVVDFQHCAEDDRIWQTYVDRLGCDQTYVQHRESAELHVVAERGRRFFEWLAKQQEQQVAVCSHAAFSRCLWNFGLEEQVPKQPPQVLDARKNTENIPIVHYSCHRLRELMRQDFDNCELRSVVISFQ